MTGTVSITDTAGITTTDVITAVEEAAEILGESAPPPPD
jgi:hypothetical protein